MKILAQDFDRVVQNVLLYGSDKSIRLREVFFAVSKSAFSGFSCDDYVAVTDSCPIEDGVNRDFALSIEDLEALGSWIKKDKKVVHKYEIDVKFSFTYITVSYDEDSKVFSFVKPNMELWDNVFELLNEEADEAVIPYWAMRDDRLAKLSKLKADKEAPVDFRGIDIQGTFVVQFKKGLSLTGVIMPVDRDLVNEEFLWKNQRNTDQSHNS